MAYFEGRVSAVGMKSKKRSKGIGLVNPKVIFFPSFFFFFLVVDIGRRCVMRLTSRSLPDNKLITIRPSIARQTQRSHPAIGQMTCQTQPIFK